MMDQNKPLTIPTRAELEAELRRVEKKEYFFLNLRRVICAAIVTAAASFFLAIACLPVLQIYGESMMPTLEKGDIVIAVKGSETAAGDLVAFYYENNILIKRCIAVGPQQVAMDQAGNVYVNGEQLVEDYLSEKSFSESDISFPYQVPLGHIFCLGDHRAVSLDSRHRNIGAISEERIIGKVVFRIWPLSKFGRL